MAHRHNMGSRLEFPSHPHASWHCEPSPCQVPRKSPSRLGPGFATRRSPATGPWRNCSPPRDPHHGQQASGPTREKPPQSLTMRRRCGICPRGAATAAKPGCSQGVIISIIDHPASHRVGRVINKSRWPAAATWATRLPMPGRSLWRTPPP